MAKRKSSRPAALARSADNATQPVDMAGQPARPDFSSAEPTEEAIRLRAYQLFLERGGAPGADFDDWLKAERELKG